MFQACFLLFCQCVCRQCGTPYIPLDAISLVLRSQKTFPDLYNQRFCSEGCADDYKQGKITEYREQEEQWG